MPAFRGTVSLWKERDAESESALTTLTPKKRGIKTGDTLYLSKTVGFGPAGARVRVTSIGTKFVHFVYLDDHNELRPGYENENLKRPYMYYGIASGDRSYAYHELLEIDSPVGSEGREG